MPLTGVEGDYVAPAARDTYFQNEPNLIAPFDFDYEPRMHCKRTMAGGS